MIAARKGELIVEADSPLPSGKFPYQGNLSGVRSDICVGNYEACNTASRHFDKVIHIFHESQNGYCDCAKTRDVLVRQEKDLFVEWKEHDLLLFKQLDEISKFVKGDGSIMVHCAAGLGRSPHIVALVLMLRGVDLASAMYSVTEALMTNYHTREVPNWDRQVLKHIDKFVQGMLND